MVVGFNFYLLFVKDLKRKKFKVYWMMCWVKFEFKGMLVFNMNNIFKKCMIILLLICFLMLYVYNCCCKNWLGYI